MGTYGQSVTLANSIIGVGILAMPFCFHQCGVILATLMLLCSGLVSRLACHFLLKSAIMSRRRNFEFLAFHVFGSAGKFAVEIGIIGFLMGTCIAYFVVVGDLGPQIIAKMFNINQSDVLRSSVMVVVSVVCVLPLGLLRKVDSLGNVSAATIGFYMCLVFKIIGEATSQIFAGDWLSKVDLWKPEGLLQCVPIFSMALFCQTQLFEILEPIPNISLDKMNEVTKNAINICTTVYILVGLFGYIAFSSQPISGNILVNMSATMASDVIKIGFVMSLAFSFPLIIFPCRASLYSLLYRRGYTPHYEALNQPIPMYRFRTLTVVIVGTTLLVSLAVPDVALVLGLLGSTVGVSVCVIFPATCFVCISLKNTNERILAQVILCFGILMMVLGTYANLQAAETQLDTHVALKTQQLPNLVDNVDKIINGDVLLKPETLQESKDKLDPDGSEIQPPNPIAPIGDKVVLPAKLDSQNAGNLDPAANSDDSFAHPPLGPDLDSEVQPKNPVPPDSDSEVQPKIPVAPDSDSENHPQNVAAPVIESAVLAPNSNEIAPNLVADVLKKPDFQKSDPKMIRVVENSDTVVDSQKNDVFIKKDYVESKEIKKKEDIMVPKVVMGDKQENIPNHVPFQKVGSNGTNAKSIIPSEKPIKENVDTILQHAIANEEQLDKIKQETLIETMKKQGEEQKEILQEQKKILKEIQESLQSKKNENLDRDPEETKKRAVESIQKIANLAIKRLEDISSKATTAAEEIDTKNQRASIAKENDLDRTPREKSLTEHIHKPDEPESYVHGEDSEKAKKENIKMSASNLKAIVDKVPIPIALRNNQPETEQLKNFREPVKGAEFLAINAEMNSLKRSEIIKNGNTTNKKEVKLEQQNKAEDKVPIKEHHSIQKREVVDCTLMSKISEDDRRICETIVSLKENSNEAIDVKLSVPDVHSLLTQIKSSDSLNSVMLNNIDLVHFKSRNLKSKDDETYK